MADLTRFARPYARAAFEFARERKDIPAWLEALALAAELIHHPLVNQSLAQPALSKEVVGACVQDMLRQKLDAYRQNFIQLLAEKGKLPLLEPIHRLFAEYVAEADATLQALLITSIKPSKAYIDTLAKALEKKYQRTVIVTSHLDETVIGGAKVIVGDEVIDATLKGQIEALAANLIR